ncbi:hypothetical protein R6Q59_026570 [Mikania micrantha]|uniref:PHD-type domain-containing protein n=1 Tax=Mikania micrantha TaxID=192012 RepID=A0A5N6L9U3_9ASTR|nr:hypothetical protein E3N88_45203 [Mikania micrantha]
MEYVKYQPEHNPEAIINYCSNGVQTGRSKNADVKDLILKAKKHLSAIGWSFFYFQRNPERRELRYRSPTGRFYYSLRTACQSVIDRQGQCIHVLEKPEEPETKLENRDDFLSGKGDRSWKKIRMEDVESSCFQQQRDQSLVDNDPGIIENNRIEGTRIQNFKQPEVLKLENHDDSLSDNRPRKKIRIEDVERLYFQQKRDQFQANKIQDFERSMKSSDKRKRKAEGSSTRRRCMLSLLIEDNVLLRGSRVSYCKKDGRVLAKGRVYDEGIQCDCCDQFFLMSKFEAHAGSTYHRPAANIFLDDGRSIFDCQTQLQHENKTPKLTKSTDYVTVNDDFCSFCNDGGELVLCDSCTSSYHSRCIGMREVPNSAYWFCPSCCCRICHEGQISNFTTRDSNDRDQIKCAQCERQFHMHCVRNLGFSVSNADSDKWLCSEKCDRISSTLKAILGKTIRLTEYNLSWRLLRLDTDENNAYECTETYNKLTVALDVMHECFQTIKHRWSDKDMVHDLIFGRSSRSNLTGFYTAVLEKDDEMVAVATLRVHGCKAAEVPLVATRFQHRRLGMCRILMNVIERKMQELGVERLVLPAVPGMVSIWTESFGFRVMTERERLDLVEYKFIDFLGTIKCHKILK